ncbi:MAG: hypothetical protein OEZ38_04905 [Gammaproteobacteria bacterium]|nr:hypothetical protein [Gammaproteobacteria bacterium]
MSDIDDDDDYDAEDGDEMLEDFEDIEDPETVLVSHSDARRRLEQLKEEKELERLIKGEFDDWNLED